MRAIHLRSKIILLSVLPILSVGILLTVLSVANSQQLGESNVDTFEDKIVELRRNELKNYTQMALTAVDHIYKHSGHLGSVEEAQAMARSIFRDLRYGNDGYFFVYDYGGKNIVHPKKPHLEGQNLWYLKDPNGVYLIQSLVREAKSDSGGYTQYIWDKPSEGREVDKLGYSMGLSQWRWMVGTGLYMDDIQKSVSSVEASIKENTQNIAFVTIGISLFLTCLVALIAIRFTVSQGRLANQNLQKLSRSSVQEREQERVRVATVLNSEVINGIAFATENLKMLKQLAESNSEEFNKKYAATGNALVKTLKSVMGIANDLHPEVLVSDGLNAAVEDLSHRLSERSGIRISVSAVNTLERPALRIETVCYRIVEESLENVLLHSNATEVSIRLRQSRNMLSLTIQDNGIGFEPYKTNNRAHDRGVGLSEMELKTELLNGSFTLFSSKGTGTIIKVAIPIPN